MNTFRVHYLIDGRKEHRDAQGATPAEAAASVVVWAKEEIGAVIRVIKTKVCHG